MHRFLIFLLICGSVINVFAQPEPCTGTPAMTSTCLTACVICDIDGFSGRNDLTTQGQTFQGFCTTMFHNMSYIAFIAGTTNLTIQVSVSNCNIGLGLEIGFFESPDCQTFIPITDCDTDVSPGTSVIFTNNQPLTVGQHYYLIMDGSNSDRCDWKFDVLAGSTAVSDLTTSGVISGASEICPNLPTTYTTTGDVGAAIFYWSVNGVGQLSQNQEIELEFPTDGTYEVCVIAANACDQAAPSCYTVEVVTPGTLTLNEVLCDNDCLEVAGQTLCETGTYNFTIPLPNGCDSFIFVNLTILPQSQEFIDINLCDGEAFFIGNTPYTTTGVFMDTILTAADCDSIVNLDLFIIICNIMGSTDFIPPVCNGDTNGFLIFSVLNGTPPFTYDWSNILEPTIGGVGSTLLFTDNMIANVPAGIYEINIQDNFGNATVMFQEVTQPSTLVVNTEAIDIDGFNLSCNGGDDGTALLTGNGGVPPYTYAWSNGASTAEITNLVAGLYTGSITDANNCVQFNEIFLTEPSVIEFQVDYIDPNCDGLETGIVQLDSVWGGTAPYQYAFSKDTFSFIRRFDSLSAGVYDFEIMDDNECLVDTSGVLVAPDIPVLFLEDRMSVDLGCDTRITTLTNSTNLIDIQWTNPDSSLDCSNCLQPVAAPLNDTKYVLSVTSVDTCSASDSVLISVVKVRDIFFPNVFSPNGDGVNDYFSGRGNKSVSLIRSLNIYSRWGELVYSGQSLPPNSNKAGWDGFFKGKLMNPGVYVWIAEMEYLDGEVLMMTGDVSLFL